MRPVDSTKFGQYFEQTGYVVPSPFKEYWNQRGGLTRFGYPLSPILVERGYLVQYFERARFEYHPEVTASAAYAVLDPQTQLGQLVELGLLIDEKLAREGRQFPPATPLTGLDSQYLRPDRP